MVKRQFQIFDKTPEYSQTTQVDIVYIVMGLHNYIKAHPGIEKDIYHILIDIPDNAGADNGGGTLQSSSTQMNAM